MNKIYQEYDFFAYFYNKYWMFSSPEYFEQALNQLLFGYLEKESHILDLCCGTGHMANIMNKNGYNVTGVDGSLLMLDYAKENAPLCKFYHHDIRDFNHTKKYKAVTCLFDSINHILDKDELLKVFENVFNHLEEGGIFLFDVNSLESCINVSLGDMSIVEENRAFISKGSFSQKEELITYNLTAFIKENNIYKRQDSCIYEKYYSEKTLTALLKKSGFNNINITYGIDLNIEALEDRIFFTLWK